AVIFMRSFAIQGALTGVYMEFFSDNPVTYFTHVGPVRAFAEAVYNVPLGFVIGDHLGGEGAFNANASFWATDGLAALGVLGVPVAAFIFILFMVVAKMLVSNEGVKFAACISIPFIMALGNASFFTNMLTGGGAILYVVVY